jgi:hypothetical protein
MESLSGVLQGLETHSGETVRLLRGISGYAPAFRASASEILAQAKGVK